MRYWLFKTEPHVYSAADLAAAPAKTGVWDGIRNYQARNFLRDEVSAGDKVFIYHCQCKSPGIYALANIKRAAYTDPAQFDGASPYFDAKATSSNPRWFCVDVALETLFVNALPVARLKQHVALESLGIFKQPRLSVVPVSKQESELILTLLDGDF